MSDLTVILYPIDVFDLTLVDLTQPTAKCHSETPSPLRINHYWDSELRSKDVSEWHLTVYNMKD